MFKGQKTLVFWVGLLILAFASVILFAILWYVATVGAPYTTLEYLWKAFVPPIVGCIVFVLIGLYMMKSGTRKDESEPRIKTL